MTDAEFLAWCLRDGAQRTALVEIDYQAETGGAATTETLYLSNRPYIDNVTPLAYDECVKSVPDYERSLTGTSLNSYQVSYGTLEIANPDGRHDFLLSTPVDGSEIRFYAGDATWPVADFRLIFACLMARAEVPALDRLTIYLKDASLLINKSIGGEVKVGGDGPNADRWRPVPFGSVNAAPCFAQDDATLTYVYADSYDIIVSDPTIWETVVRDRGVPVDYNDNGDGSFSLIAAPDGEITADIMAADGSFAGNRCVSDAVDYFIGDRAGLNALGRYAGPGATYDTRPGSGIAAWVDAGGEDYLIGNLLTDRRNAIELLNELTETGNCSWACTRDGNLTLGRLRPHDITSLGVTPKRAIVEDDIDDGTLRINHALPTYYRLQCRSSRNWTIVQDLAGVLTPEERDHLTRPGLYKIQDLYSGATYLDSPQSYHLSMAESPTIDTLLSGFNDSIDIVRAELWMGVRRGCLLPWLETVTLRTGMDRYDHEIFDVVPIDFTKTGRLLFDPARDAQIVRIKISITAWKVELGLFHRREGSGPGEDPPAPPDPEPDPGVPAAPAQGFPSCALNPIPCILTQGFAPICILEINCGGSECAVACGTGFASEDMNTVEFLNPDDGVTVVCAATAISPLTFGWAYDTWGRIRLGTGMDLCTADAGDVSWFATIYGYETEFGAGYEDATEHDVTGSVFGPIQVYPYATSGGPYGGAGTGAIADGWEIGTFCGRTFGSGGPPWLDTSMLANTLSFSLQAKIGGTPICDPIVFTQDDAVPVEI